ncbi:MAG TPA: uroporphyrinogen decarboxylase [Rhizomicrobium sp.]|nr:uroporphyrinogen decarboxylase [Rhizomicrobium sp.]
MKEEKKILSVLKGDAVWPPPVWLMRQAGRYLPEYRELRAKAGSFLAMAMNPEIATEITLQPVRRYGFDAAILFSDILTVPMALGFDVVFDEGKGPRVVLGDKEEGKGLEIRPKKWAGTFEPVYEAVRQVRSKLDGRTALLGFAGGPWTLATYMVKGAGSEDQRAAKLWGYRDPEGFAKFLAVIGECVAFHLVRQIEAGAEAVQIFDSWAGSLTAETFEQWVVVPAKRIVQRIRETYPDVPVIGFPRATSLPGYERYAKETGVTAISVDSGAPIDWAAGFAKSVAVQGNLDPVALIAGGSALAEATDRILETMRGKPFIFNLGHGVLPPTPVEHVAELVNRIRTAR